VTWTVSNPGTADKTRASIAVNETRRFSPVYTVTAGVPQLPWRDATDLSMAWSVHVGAGIFPAMDDEPSRQTLMRGVGHSKPKWVEA